MTDQASLSIVSLVIAVVGLSLAVASLVWQIVAWLLTGSRVKVRATRGFLTAGPYILSVEARNIGRLPASVTAWGFLVPSGDQIIELGPGAWQGPPMPYTIEPYHAATWHVPGDQLRASLQHHGLDPRTRLRGFVNLGTGRQLVARKGLEAWAG